MLKLAALFFVLAIASAVLGFGGFAGTFTSLAVIAFYVFVAFLVFSLLASLVGAGHGHSGGAFASLVVAAIAGAGIYAWIDSGMSAQELGAKIDRSASTMTAEAEQAVETAGMETQGFLGDVGDSAKDAVNDTAEQVDGDGR